MHNSSRLALHLQHMNAMSLAFKHYIFKHAGAVMHKRTWLPRWLSQAEIQPSWKHCEWPEQPLCVGSLPAVAPHLHIIHSVTRCTASEHTNISHHNTRNTAPEYIQLSSLILWIGSLERHKRFLCLLHGSLFPPRLLKPGRVKPIKQFKLA